MCLYDKSDNRFLNAGFTLAELLVVMFIITLMLGALASFPIKPDVNRRLKTAAQLFQGKLREARGVAAMRQSNARLLVHADKTQPELQWNAIVIIVESEPDSNIWEPVGNPERLPEAVFWVPTDTHTDWSGASSFGGLNMQLVNAIGSWQAGSDCWAYEFKPTGRISSLRYDCYLSEGTTTGVSQPHLVHPHNLRGLRVNTYGQISEVASAVLPK